MELSRGIILLLALLQYHAASIKFDVIKKFR
jgi:hypothetical protein